MLITCKNLCRKLKRQGPLLMLYFVKPSSTNEVVTSSTVQEGPKGSVVCQIRELGLAHHGTFLVLRVFLHNSLTNDSDL